MFYVRISVVTVLLILSYSLTITEGFLPNRKRWAAANLLFSPSGTTTTHKGMTRNAILEAAGVVLSKSSSQNVQQLINSNTSFDVQGLISSYYASYFISTLALAWDFNWIIEYINRQNAKVDYKSGEFTVAAAHFDSEQFKSGQNRLRCFRKAIPEEIKNRNYDTARKYTGRMLHTLQDFYSHTNWIENMMDDSTGVGSDTSSYIYNALGQFDMEITNTVSESIPTCSDCTKSGSLKKRYGILVFLGIIQTRSVYRDCKNNLETSVTQQKMLTSGYYKDGKDDMNRKIRIPSGKCSHGGITDGSTDDFPKGGINKDSTHPELAPHYNLHELAANVAAKHSLEMLLKIRNEVSDDKLFLEFLGINEGIASSISVVLLNLDDRIMQEIQELFFRTATSILQFGNRIQYNGISMLDGGKNN